MRGIDPRAAAHRAALAGGAGSCCRDDQSPRPLQRHRDLRRRDCQRIYDQHVKDGDTSSPRYATGGMYAAVVLPGVIRPGDAMILMEESA